MYTFWWAILKVTKMTVTKLKTRYNYWTNFKDNWNSREIFGNTATCNVNFEVLISPKFKSTQGYYYLSQQAQEIKSWKFTRREPIYKRDNLCPRWRGALWGGSHPGPSDFTAWHLVSGSVDRIWSENTWEPEENLAGAQRVLKGYKQKHMAWYEPVDFFVVLYVLAGKQSGGWVWCLRATRRPPSSNMYISSWWVFMYACKSGVWKIVWSNLDIALSGGEWC